MTGQLYSYDFKEVSCIVGGFIGSGFAEGDDCIEIDPGETLWDLVTGADGEGTRSKRNNSSSTITLRLMAGSQLNDTLNSFYLADKLSNSGKFPFMVKDNNGRSIHSSEECWVELLPKPTFGQNPGVREWVLRTNNMDHNIGGS